MNEPFPALTKVELSDEAWLYKTLFVANEKMNIN